MLLPVSIVIDFPSAYTLLICLSLCVASTHRVEQAAVAAGETKAAPVTVCISDQSLAS